MYGNQSLFSPSVFIGVHLWLINSIDGVQAKAQHGFLIRAIRVIRGEQSS